MSQTKLVNTIQSKAKSTIPYARGSYNKTNSKEQWIRISEGCPNGCEYCRETFECGTKPIYFKIPEIVRNTVKIIDMNLLYKPKALEIINKLGNIKVNKKIVKYEFICGIDYRYLTEELSIALKKNRFINIRFAWDGSLRKQIKIRKAVQLLTSAGYEDRSITVFIISNWKISFKECCNKLDLLKIWNIKVADCWFDNQLMPNVKPIYWTHTQIKDFRHKCRKHNQYVRFKIDPELY